MKPSTSFTLRLSMLNLFCRCNFRRLIVLGPSTWNTETQSKVFRFGSPRNRQSVFGIERILNLGKISIVGCPLFVQTIFFVKPWIGRGQVYFSVNYLPNYFSVLITVICRKECFKNSFCPGRPFIQISQIYRSRYEMHQLVLNGVFLIHRWAFCSNWLRWWGVIIGVFSFLL